MAFKFGNKINNDGLVFYLDAANPKSYTSGSSNWNDISKNGANCTLVNVPGYNSGSRGSIVFDGSVDYVTGTDLNTALMSISSNVTIETCVYISSVPVYTFTGIFNYGDPVPNYGICVAKTSGNPYVGVQGGGGIYKSSVPIILNSWNHVCVTLGSDNSIYMNGVFAESHTRNLSLSAYNVIRVGLYNTIYLNGRVSLVRVYNKILSSTEVFQNFNATRTRFNL